MKESEIVLGETMARLRWIATYKTAYSDIERVAIIRLLEQTLAALREESVEVEDEDYRQSLTS